MGKSCCSHAVTGTCLGYFFLGCSAIAFIYNLFYFARLAYLEKPKYSEALEMLIVFNSCCLFLKMRKEHLNDIARFEQQLCYDV